MMLLRKYKILLIFLSIFLIFFVTLKIIYAGIDSQPESEIEDTATPSKKLESSALNSPIEPLSASENSEDINETGDINPEADNQIEPTETSPALQKIGKLEILTILEIIIIISLIANVLAILMIMYLFRWRKVITQNDNALMPQQWVENFASRIKKMTKYLQQVVDLSSHNHKKLSEISEIIATFQKALDEKDTEIKRYKSGYDAHIYERYLSKFILITRRLQEILENQEIDKSDINSIHIRLEDALEDCGVMVKDIEIGSDYREQGAFIADNPELIVAKTEKDVGKIVTVKRPAYIIRTPEGEERVVIPAQASVYSNKKEN